MDRNDCVKKTNIERAAKVLQTILPVPPDYDPVNT